MKRGTFKIKPRKALKRSRLRKPKEKTLKTILDNLYSQYVRRSQADDRGYINCYCGARVHWQESDNSHYIPRGCLSLRYDPRNTHPSCRKCNRFMGGNIQAYSRFLLQRYGASILDDLERDKRKITKNFPFEEKIAHYTALLGTLE